MGLVPKLNWAKSHYVIVEIHCSQRKGVWMLGNNPHHFSLKLILCLATGISVVCSAPVPVSDVGIGYFTASPSAASLSFTLDFGYSASKTTYQSMQIFRRETGTLGQDSYSRTVGGTTYSIVEPYGFGSWGTAIKSFASQAEMAAASYRYVDTGVQAGKVYEYKFVYSYLNNGTTWTGQTGYATGTIERPLVEFRGTLILLVDDTMVTPLGAEIAQLEQDLRGDGWTVVRHSVSRTATPPQVRALVQADYNADPANIKAVYLLGRIPVPYSGDIFPDGHADHIGAWPTDGYYGDVNTNYPGTTLAVWRDTDVSDSTSTADGTRNRNVPGDGKFDLSGHRYVELQVGRVDMAKMPSFASETDLLRRYLLRAHDYRHRSGAYAMIQQKAFSDDNWSGGYSQSLINAAASHFGLNNGSLVAGDYFTDLPAAGTPYLFAYGGGGGGFTSIGGVGESTNFVASPVNAVFTMHFGSYFGDWDNSADNILRAPLAGPAGTLPLVSFWSSRPDWITTFLAQGETIGHVARMTMNNVATSGEIPNQNAYGGYVHIGLMGDPALRTTMVPPVRNLRATPGSGSVLLAWDASIDPGLLGYHVYRATDPTGPFIRLTGGAISSGSLAGTPISATTYTDSAAVNGISYTYMVRVVARTTNASSTYINASIGEMVTTSAAVGAIPSSPTAVTATSVATTGTVVSWTDTSTNETGFVLERRTGNGTWTQAGSVSANSTTFTDPAPLVAGEVTWYRIKASGASGDSAWSELISLAASQGEIRFPSAYLKVDASSATAQVPVERVFGSFGPAGITVSIPSEAGSTAVAGTHYTNTTQTLTWADGESGTKYFSIPILNSASTRLTRSLRVQLASPTGGVRIGAYSYAAVALEDRRTSLSAPWAFYNLGNAGSYRPRITGLPSEAEGCFGMASATSKLGGGTDVFDFIYRSVGGDAQMVARIKEAAMPNVGGRAGICARFSGAYSAQGMFVGLEPAAGKKQVGSLTRTTEWGANTEVTQGSATISPPYWVRLTRTGSTLKSERSPDGSSWTQVDLQTLTGAPESMIWGMVSSPNNYYMTQISLAAFDQVSLTRSDRPTGLTALNMGGGQAQLSWADNSSSETGYRVERSDGSGGWVRVGDASANATTYTVSGLDPNTAYSFRVAPIYSGFSFHDCASPLYVEGFANSFGQSFGDVGWKYYRNSTAIDETSTFSQVFGNYNTGSDNIPGLNSATSEAFGDGYTGPIIRTNNASTFLLYTEEYTIPAGIPRNKLVFSIDQKDTDSGASPIRFAIRIGSQWFVSGSRSTAAASANFTRQGVDLATEPTWYALAFTAGSNLALGSAATLPNGAITAFGIYAEPGFNQSGMALDTFRVGYWDPYVSVSNIASMGVGTPNSPSGLAVTLNSSTDIALSWADNSSNETGFLIDRKSGAAGAFATIATTAAGVTNYNDPGPIQANATFYYRVTALGASGNSSPSPEVSVTGVPGTLALGASSVSANKTSGSVNLSVTRTGGSIGPVSIAYSTAGDSAIAGTHFSAVSGNLTWPSGDTTSKTISIPILSPSGASHTRSFRLNLGAATGGALVGSPATATITISDPTATTLPAGWTGTVLGTFSSVPSSATYASDGSLGSLMSEGTIGDTSDAIRFMYRDQSGDAVMTAYLPAPTPAVANNNARFGLMIRGDATSANGTMVAFSLSGGNEGARLWSRSAPGTLPTATSPGFSTVSAPAWVRIIRNGSLFTAQASIDGSQWTTVDSCQNTGIPANAKWGIFHVAASGQTQLFTVPLAQFSILPPPVPPGIAPPLAADLGGSNTANLYWGVVFDVGATYEIERSENGGAYVPLGMTFTPGYTDSGPLNPDSIYQYRVRGVNSTGASPYVNSSQLVTPAPDGAIISLTPVADAYISGAGASNNYGNYNNLQLNINTADYSDNSVASMVYLEFDLASLPSGVISAAKLQLTLAQAAGRSGTWWLAWLSILNESYETWTEYTITYNNAPGKDPGYPHLLWTGNATDPVDFGTAAYSGNLTAGTRTTISADSTALPALQEARDTGNQKMTLVMTSAGWIPSLAFASREHATYAKPALVITMAAHPQRPSDFNVSVPSTGNLSLTWTDNSLGESGFRIEYSPDGGTTWQTLMAVPANVTQAAYAAPSGYGTRSYRVVATSGSGDSLPSLVVSADANPDAFAAWAQARGLPANGTGSGALGATPANDGITNFMKCALGIDPYLSGYQGALAHSTIPVASKNYLALTFKRPDPSPAGFFYTVKTSSDLLTWSALNTLEVSSGTANGVRTTTIRDTVSTDAVPRRFIRLEVSR